MKILLKYKFLLTIIVIAAILRLWQLGVVPPSPDWDETALGYNAYSILKTGRDEYGTWFPLTIRSFDDYKPPLYVYLTIPSVGLFGLNTPAVRLPSVIMGIVAVLGTYFLAKELLDQREKEDKYIPYLASLFLAISPWHIQFSRIAFEANIGVTLNILGVVFFLKGLRSRQFLWLSAFIFGLSLYAYHSERIFMPLLVLILAISHWKNLMKMRQATIVAIIVGMFTAAPLIPVFLNQNTLMRLRGTSSLSDQTGLLARTVKKLDDDKIFHNYVAMIFDNRRLVWAKTLVDGYLSHYSFKWLFLNGDNARHHAPDMGVLYFVELPFLLWGMYRVGRQGGIMAKVLFGWFLIAPVAASPTTELPHGIRTLVFLPTFQIFTAVGVSEFFSWIKDKKFWFARLGAFLCIGLFTFNIAYYLHMYFGHTNREYSKFWQYGYQQAVAYTQKNKDKYKKIVVSTKLEQPHMFFLYYLKYDPARYLKEGGTASGGFAEVRNKFDIYEFRPIHWEKEIADGSTLYIGLPGEIPVAPLQTIYYLDGTEAMRIADK